jgi:hypothetical protein
MLKARYDGEKMERVKGLLMAQSDKDEITGFTQKLEDSFGYFMVSCSATQSYLLIFVQNFVANFIARQTLLTHKEIDELRTQRAEKGKTCDGLRCCAKTSRDL